MVFAEIDKQIGNGVPLGTYLLIATRKRVPQAGATTGGRKHMAGSANGCTTRCGFYRGSIGAL